MTSFLFYILAAFAEIAGCFSFWAWTRLGKSMLWTIPGTISLVFFAWILTKVDIDIAGRAYAIYGGIYIVCSLLWLWVVEDTRPDKCDIVGAVICLFGASIILLAPRS
ncbi:YnfA family protein [Commensalibacter oyaizuii]|uniref:YnfA family protein n=1 Tax=Commensalibacter oyaizuii TaxID=3043873 RepID=A0ABT6Q3A4_9PROT|nr:YnfA family protein [Commensalibacter sp. TBRC 16381]MDI2091583.1 YnfA family protein [Commensalibacter sp. TBRC 16381]